MTKKIDMTETKGIFRYVNALCPELWNDWNSLRMYSNPKMPWISSKDLYYQYREWCESKGMKPARYGRFCDVMSLVVLMNPPISG